MSLLGIDIGTTGCKAAVFSEDGTCIAQAYREYAALHRAEGQAELDSAKVWGETRAVISEAATAARHDPVTALCVSAMGEAATPVSDDRRILGNCILSSDTRGRKYVDMLTEHYGQQRFYEINPNILGTNYTLPKMLWLRENTPTLYEQTDTFLLWDGLAGFMLGCDPYTSYSNANRTLLFDIEREDWSDEILGTAGIDRKKLAHCLPGGAIAGTVSDSIADEIGLPRGVKVIVGGHDQCCNALGAGLSQAGRAVDGIGTFECITPVYDDVPAASTMLKLGLNVEHHVVDGLYMSFLYNQGGSLVRWFRDTFARERRDERDIYNQLAAEMPVEPTNLFVLPYFEMTGSPRFVSDASGVIVGLKSHTTRGEILKAIMESVTYYFVESIESLRQIGIDTSGLVATGGGAQSDPWLQIKADILGVPIVRPRITECGLLGAAILAGTATGVFSTPEEGVERFVCSERVFEPNKTRHLVYRERLEKYRELFPLMKDYLSAIDRAEQANTADREGGGG